MPRTYQSLRMATGILQNVWLASASFQVSVPGLPARICSLARKAQRPGRITAAMSMQCFDIAPNLYKPIFKLFLIAFATQICYGSNATSSIFVQHSKQRGFDSATCRSTAQLPKVLLPSRTGCPKFSVLASTVTLPLQRSPPPALDREASSPPCHPGAAPRLPHGILTERASSADLANAPACRHAT